jgi:hypothetical protein
MRYREKLNSLSEGTYVNSDDKTPNAPGEFSTVVTYISAQQYIAMLDVVTPNWRKIIGAGGIINNPMLMYAYDSTVVPALVTCDGYWPSDPTKKIRCTRGFVIPPVSTPTSLDWEFWAQYILADSTGRDIALAQAWANVDISEMQALASLGELPETLRWMTSLVGRVVSLIRAFSQKKLMIQANKLFRSGKSVIDAMSDLWLEFRYAVRPLVFDMQQAINAWNASVARSQRFTARGYHRDTKSTETSTYDLVESSSYHAIVSRVSTREANYRAGVMYTIDSDINGFTSIWGLDQPLETVWELIPFSFIVDWFFSVGDTLAQFTANPGLHPLCSFVTEEVKETTVDTINSITWDATYVLGNWTCTEGQTTTSVVTKRRLPAPSRPLLPKFRLKLDTAKLFDLVAIGRGLISSLH